MTRLPELDGSGFAHSEIDDHAKSHKSRRFNWVGGEQSALQRVEEYIFKNDSLLTYETSRDNLSCSECSSFLGPWIANGSLSVRYLYHEV